MFKKLFSGLLGVAGAGASEGGTKAVESVEYKEYLIVSQPDNQSGQFRVSGWIRKLDGEGVTHEHRFERSDMLPGREDCDAMMVAKAQRFIDEVGEEMFAADPRNASET